MNTPSHAIINLVILGNSIQPEANLWIVAGSILPDLPIFLFYGWAKLIAKMPEKYIWSKAYYYPVIQNLTSIFHSIPLAVIGSAIALLFGWKMLTILCLSLVLHSCFDLPVHHDDAHRHFLPFSNYRFISPISYWDRKHYGMIVALVEIVLVLLSTCWLFPIINSWIGKVLMVIINGLYGFAYIYVYARTCLKLQ